jgi:B-box zinc finger
MNELSSILEVLQKKNKMESCKEHKIQLLYFCNTCNVSLCSDCYMFGNLHKEHQIKHLKEIYDHHLEIVKSGIKELQFKLDKLTDYLARIEERIDFFRQLKQEKASELEDLYKSLKEKSIS